MKPWFRLERSFDPATLVAVVVAGLLPTALILAISSFTLTGMSISLSDLLEEPHRERVRTQAQLLSAEIEAGFAAWETTLARAVESRDEGEPVAPPRGGVGLLSLTWIPVTAPGSIESSGDARAVEARLRSVLDLDDPVRREETLRVLAALPPELEDDLGFSYAIEASLAVDPRLIDPRAVLTAPAIDRETLRAWRETIPAGEVTLPGWSVPLAIDLESAPPRPALPALVEEDESRFRLVIPEVGSGTVIAEFHTDRFLHAALGSIPLGSSAGEEVFTALRPAGERDERQLPGRVWARWPLPPPFATTHELITGTQSDETPVPLALLQRLEGVQLVWGGLLVVVVAIGVSLVLGALAARRVRVSNEKDNFLRLVSHELRTPIASIQMISETLGLGRVRNDEERAEFVAQLERESARLSDLVERVLEFGRGDAGARQREVITDPGELVEEVVARFREAERQAGSGDEEALDPAPIEIRSSQFFHPVLLDREAVTGVIQNLLSNARKYSPRGSPIEVTVGEESRQLFISVRDQGTGIRRRDQKRVFQSFYRGEHGGGKRGESGGPSGPVTPGFGLGLAYCQQVARAHRGRITLRSAVGKGSTFTLEIPLDAGRAEGEDDVTDPHRRG